MERRARRAGTVIARATTLGLLALGAVTTPAAAQSRPAAPPPARTGPVEVLPPAQGQGQAGQQGGSGPSQDEGAEPAAKAEKKGPATPAAGYAYADKAPASGAKHARFRSKGPVVNMPGFEQTADGGSRLFVQLSQTVPVEERRAQGSLTYVLKGASPRVWNNTNALVTVHFNTPVSRARLVPQGSDLLFVVDLRAAATPTWKLNEGTDHAATLAIEFPKGDYLGANGEPPPAAQNEPAAPRGKPAGRGKRAPGAGAAPRP